MIKAYYATTNVGRYKEFRVVVLDDERHDDAGLIATGYFQEIKEPERGRPEGAHRAG